MASLDDPAVVGRHEDEHLRRFCAVREAGDRARMVRCWGEVVTDIAPRMDGIVFAVHRGQLDRDEHEEAVQDALIKVATNLRETFKGTSMGELVNATKTLAFGICVDTQRRSRRRREHEAGSFDAARADDEGVVGTETWEMAQAARRDAVRRDERRQAEEDVAWLFDQLDAARDRRVMELTLHGAQLPEIMDDLGVSRDNAYQLRCRAMKKLAKHRKELGR